MPPEPSFLNRAVAFTAAVVYWLGVWLQARRVRHRIGRSPNVKPRGAKEKLLWAGWFVVIGLWLSIPFIAGRETFGPWGRPFWPVSYPLITALGIALMLGGYAGTLWCYSAMGQNWRMGVKSGERTSLVTTGPFRFARNPIYLLQVVMLAGLILLLPTLLSLLALSIHLLCVLMKIADEESFLLATHGTAYQQYHSRTGKLLPKLTRRKTAPPLHPSTQPATKSNLPLETNHIDSPRT
jgi:protein-S-isoprenylcysteine O-methyltransferase Ste14